MRRDADCGRGVVVAVARKCGSTTTSNVYCRDVDNSGNGDGEPFQLIKFKNRSFWTNEEVTNERLKVGSLLNCQTVSGEQSKLDGKQFIETIGVKPQDVTQLLFDLQDYESVYRGLEWAHGYVNLKVHRFFRAFLDKNELIEKLYTKLHEAHARIYFIGIRACTIKNERVALETMDGELLDMPLNCRENLVLSTAPVQLQLKRPGEVGNDDVGGVAVVKYEACKFTCEGLILRYKPLVISRDEEPVQIKNGCGKVIPVSRCHCVLFDTGNDAATGISRELLLELNLQPYRNKKREVKLAGGRLGQFEMVEIELVIRGHHFNVCALIDAPAEGTDLLVGMDIIRQLYDLGYTIGE
ncbi:hypothetical protein AWC38_SpisGene23591 [Stylophora pistillata]|uniref:Uncharacterized protein n=1 Tax=Stylophora pistillata TaxID=50429 RepID=A0A2B4R8A5_STYPI|nr:hypothetical protein AWC38_SpisGene23591 [Stylophora pistillata]